MPHCGSNNLFDLQTGHWPPCHADDRETNFLFVFIIPHFACKSDGCWFGSIWTQNNSRTPSIVAVIFTSKKLSIKYNVDIARNVNQKFPSLTQQKHRSLVVFKKIRRWQQEMALVFINASLYFSFHFCRKTLYSVHIQFKHDAKVFLK